MQAAAMVQGRGGLCIQELECRQQPWCRGEAGSEGWGGTPNGRRGKGAEAVPRNMSSDAAL